MDNTMNNERIYEFIGPSGHSYTIREQNGNDDDVLSNQSEASTLMNISRFISGIIVNTSFKSNGLITPEEVQQEMPILDRTAILLQSRIHSLGDTLEFNYNWGKGPDGKELVISYEQDLYELLFDYSKTPDEETLNQKPNAVPFYAGGKKLTNLEINTRSGKQLQFDILTPAGEVFIMSTPSTLQTVNTGLLARNLRLLVDGKYERVQNFKLFSPKDMQDIRNAVNQYDPIYLGMIDIENTQTKVTTKVPFMSLDNFFYLGEI